ncbi:MAG: 4Fe-4S dicluster domain-containing protein [Candidatus Omnitrophota bacterium]|jgi:formate dehydrogenase iron-sulfur subunit|nr:MAG: 4Fe-4S dicluster domain-containing protein [Candidatus Omnitrophota bacterium]
MKAILTDITRCIGCDKCKEACYNQYNKGKVCAISADAKDDLSEATWTTVLLVDRGNVFVKDMDQEKPDFPKDVSEQTILSLPQTAFVRKQCLHCNEPTCEAVCPVGAFHKDQETGAVIYESHKCIGCRYCMYACPFGIPRYEWGTPFPVVQKCILCYEEIKTGRKPACTEACQDGATIFGDRDELIAEAHRRIEQEPGRYRNHVYGEHEAGGTAVLYLTKPQVPLDFLFHQRLGVDPLPSYTWQWLAKVPTIGMSAAFAGTGLFWIIKRRNLLAQGEEALERKEPHA